jgi:hypothetical protein
MMNKLKTILWWVLGLPVAVVLGLVALSVAIAAGVYVVSSTFSFLIRVVGPNLPTF